MPASSGIHPLSLSLPAPSRRLAPFLLLAALLHLAALLGLRPLAMSPPLLSRPLEVSIEQLAPPAPQAAPVHMKAMTSHPGGLHSARPVETAPKRHDTQPAPAVSSAASAAAQPAPLDMNKLLGQAREYARQSPNVGQPADSLEGEYSGSYDGLDTGTFNFWLDRAGHGSGSGLSSRYGISFLIRGQVDQDGSIRMTGSGVAGDAKFSGTLNPSTGEFSGKWTLGKGGGTFRGRREQAIGQASPAIAQTVTPIATLKQAMQQPHKEITLASGMRKITTESGGTVCYQPVPHFARDMPGLFGIPIVCP